MSDPDYMHMLERLTTELAGLQGIHEQLEALNSGLGRLEDRADLIADAIVFKWMSPYELETFQEWRGRSVDD